MFILLDHRTLGECSCGKWIRLIVRQYTDQGCMHWIVEALDWDGELDTDAVKEFGACYDDLDLALEEYHKAYDPDEFTHGR